MTPNWDTVNAAVKEARVLRRTLMSFADDLADVLIDLLHLVGASKLRRLKRELTKFDSAQGRWK